MLTLCRAQSVPKRSGTTRLLVARRGTNGQVRDHTNRLTSLLVSTDNALWAIRMLSQVVLL